MKRSRDLVRSHPFAGWGGYGDWLSVDAPPHDVSRAPTPKDLIGTAYLAHDVRLLAEVARRIGRDDEARELGDLDARVRETFRREFVTGAGRVLGDTQTGYLLALAFDLLEEAQRPYALDHLVQNIRDRGWHLSTGFVGTPLLGPVLSRFGRHDVAYRLLLQETYPSWLYSIHQGATTMWERWNSYSKDKGFGDVGMNSFNHYAYGAIGEWLYATVAGLDLDPEQPGYKRLRLRPTPPPLGEDGSRPLTHARATLETLHGRAVSGWRVEGETLHYEAVVPPNTTALIELPARGDVREGGRDAPQSEGLRRLEDAGDRIRFDAAAGRYAFEATLHLPPPDRDRPTGSWLTATGGTGG